MESGSIEWLVKLPAIVHFITNTFNLLPYPGEIGGIALNTDISACKINGNIFNSVYRPYSILYILPAMVAGHAGNVHQCNIAGK